MPEAPPIVLVFAATDPSGGAGTQADILTVASMGCHALCVITAVTVQDTEGVRGVRPMPSALMLEQARCVLEDSPVSVFKVGLVGSVAGVEAIAEILAEYPDIPMILDPVLASGRGDELADREVIEAMRELLVPSATLVTPNSIEARKLASPGAEEQRDLAECAARLIEWGAEYVLVTGTHVSTPEVVNVLYGSGGVIRQDAWPRLPDEYHGSGCTLASACAAAMANGLDVPAAVADAQEFTWRSLQGAYVAGAGQLIPDRLFWARTEEPEHGAD